MNALWLIVDFAVAAWLISLLFQAGDLATARFDSVAVGARAASGRTFPPRLHRFFWLLPLTALLSAGVAVGGAYSAVLMFAGRVSLGIVFVLAVIAVAVAIALLAVVAATRRQKPGYAALRHRLRELSGVRLTTPRIASFRAELAAIDSRCAIPRLGYGDGSRSPRARAEVAELSAQLVKQPNRSDVVRSIRWQSANEFLFAASPWRVVPIVLAVLVGIAVAAASANGGILPAAPWLVALTVLPVALSYLLAVVSARYFLASRATWHAVELRQRAEVVGLLEEFERSARKGVAGLGDRVTRALQILREQQQA